jgi:calcineurin-like phosphoesterase family protein
MKIENYFWEPLKFSSTDIWFWSDLHLGHRCESWETPLWKTRGFNSVEEHDQTLIERWNSSLKESSTLFHIGDILFGMNGEERLRNVLNRLNFKELYIMSGNHSAGYKQLLSQSLQRSDGVRYLDYNYKIIYFIPNYLEMFICGQPIVCSHYPLASWNGQSKGSWMIHGHCHGNLYKSELGKILYECCKIKDVGVECSPSPSSFNDLKCFFSSKENGTFDHHDSNTQNPF